MILVTGATGFLGHNLIPQLLAADHAVRVLARPDSDVSFLASTAAEIALAADITDRPALECAAAGCDVIIHAAGLFRFWGSAAAFQRTNVDGTAAALAAAVGNNVSRFIYISTAAIVGKPIPGRIIDESHPCQPQDDYQASKLAAEALVLAQGRQGLPVIILRPGAFYGPWGRYAFNRLFFEEPLRGWRIKVNGARHITFPSYVPDVAQAIILALSRGRPGEIYNVCSESLSHEEVNDIVSDLAGISRWRFNFPTRPVIWLATAWTALSRVTHREPFYPINMAG